jgi:hypothetical protein
MPDSMRPSPCALVPGFEHGGLGVVLVPGAKEQLSKAQLTFKRLVKRIEKLRRKIDTETERLCGYLDMYTTELRPLEVELANQHKTLVRLLYPYLNDPSLGGRDSKAVLRQVLQDQLSSIIEVLGELAEEDLQAIYAVVEGKTVKDAEAEDFVRMREELEEMLGTLGVDADLSRFQPGMSDAEMAAHMAELKARVEEERLSQETKTERPKTQRQKDREAREQAAEELRKRDVGGLYRQLAKLLHPDLEQDPVLRAEKEAAMKQLTTAYKNSDLHGMLLLEVAWIAREQADASRLTDQKLAIYNKVLKEQVAELEEQLDAVLVHPRFQPLMQYVDPFFQELNFNGPAEKRALQGMLRSIKKTLASLRGPNAGETVADILEAFTLEKRSPILW